ncbi:sensory histidine kinase AtoS [Desulfocucumis palustris]|uniref:histidine kinase n=1 Tax=Desulfocucumis palustris TaxID=1898651 RepID=A0A2L2XB24_9FIRM|nr:two-component system sensor histidine kinase AtoS [Desulfocucumis palustris]GBF33272.1 sensory histidine kinase AtoS [Desulfocucumis palustris]
MKIKIKKPNIKYEGFINQLLILIVVLLLIPIVLTFYLFHMVHSTQLGMINNQRKVLEEVLDHLDKKLDRPFDSMLVDLKVQNLPKRDQEKALNQALRPILDEVAQKYPGVDIGYYSKEFDVILDGDNQHLNENFSERRKRNFDDTLETKNLVFNILGQAENGQLEAYQPLVKDGKVIGAVWAIKNINQIYRTVGEIQQVVYVIIFIGAILAFTGAFVLINKFARTVSDIKKGLNIMGNDPTYVIPRATGELGEITDAVNEMFSKLVNMQNYNEIILTSLEDGIITVDRGERIISLNQAARNLLNLDGSCLGQKIDEVFPGESPFIYYLRKTRSENRPFKDLDVIFGNGGDEARHLLLSTSTMVNVRGEQVDTLLHFRDITEIVRLQENMNRQQRLASLGKLVAGVAHEIRSPLTSITGYIQFWTRGHVPSPKSLGIVNREMNRLSAMTDKLLEFARPSRAVLEECDLNGLVKRLVQFFADAHSGGEMEISYSYRESLPPARIDSGQIEQVLSNILYNAYQATDGRGRLEISTGYDAERDMLEVTVRDDGCGIPDDVLPKMFEPFFTTKSKGTGLGLAIAYEIMEAHNGLIQVDSELGRGTTVKIYLPTANRGESNAAGADS